MKMWLVRDELPQKLYLLFSGKAEPRKNRVKAGDSAGLVYWDDECGHDLGWPITARLVPRALKLKPGGGPVLVNVRIEALNAGREKGKEEDDGRES